MGKNSVADKVRIYRVVRCGDNKGNNSLRFHKKPYFLPMMIDYLIYNSDIPYAGLIPEPKYKKK